MTAWLLVLVLAAVQVHAGSRQLVFVHMLWRHGDRSPSVEYPADQRPWPQGLGELTPEGMREELRLGQLLRRRYVPSLLPPSYSQFNVHVRSTDVNRTLQSAYGVMAGLWSGQPNQTIPGESSWPQPWLPVPVHTVPKPSDHLLYPLLPCKTYSAYLKNVQEKSPEYLKVANDNKAFMAWLSTKTGMKVTVTNIWLIGDETFIEQLHNRTVPSWVNSTVLSQILKIKRYSSRLLFLGQHQARLGCGALITEAIARMAAVVDCRAQFTEEACRWLSRVRLYGYSAHDITVMCLLSVLGRTDAVPSHGLPPYAAALGLELWQEADGSYSVQTVYKNGILASNFSVIYPSGCPTGRPCPLSTFAQRSQPYIIKDVVAECNGNVLAPPACPSAAGLTAAEVVLSLLVVVLGMALLFASAKVYHLKNPSDPQSGAKVI